MHRTRDLFRDDVKAEALAGPIQLKDPNSFEFAFQQLYWIKTLYTSWNSSLHEWEEAVEKADQFKIYERLPDPKYPYGSLDAMLEAELGVTRDQGTKTVRERTTAAAKKTTGEVRPEGRPNNSTNYRVSSQKQRAIENGVSYQTQVKLDRLAEHHRDLHAKVASGDLSVNRACIQAGFVQPEFLCPLEPQAAARRILNRFSGGPLLELIRILANHAGVRIVETPDE